MEPMELREYFENTKGIGVLATTDAQGKVNQAIYGRPHFLDDLGTCSFIMSNRLSHENMQQNPSASYLFIAEGEGYIGKRLSLTIIGEETDPKEIEAACRRNTPAISKAQGKYLVHFHVEAIRPLVGTA